jgi:hypothetical protein
MSDEDVTPRRPPTDRRAFLKRLTREAIDTAEMLARSRGLPERSAAAAVDAARGELGSGVPPDPRSGNPPAGSPPAAPARPSADRLRPLTDDERRLLRGATVAVVAVNVPSGPPHLSRAPFHWDGEVVRSLGSLFAARVSHIERDSRISLLIEDGTGWLTLTGEARIVSGAGALDEARPLLAHVFADESADAAWVRLTSGGDQAVIVVRPIRIVSRFG